MNCRSACPISCTLDIIGDKWTLLIIRDMAFLDKKNFREIQQSPEGIASNILASRLKLLVETGIVTKTQNPDNLLKVNYELTEKGKALTPAIKALAEWGMEHIDGTYKAPPPRKG